MNMKVSVGLAVACLTALAVSQNLGGYAFVARAAVCVMAFAAALQAARADRHLWMIGLALTALVFNPLFSVTAPAPLILWTIVTAIGIQIGWVVVLERLVAPQTAAEVLHPRGFAK